MNKRPSIILSSFAIAAACFAASSCGRDVVFSKIQPVENKVWDKWEEYYFAFEIKDNSVPYDVSLQLRNSDAYGYQNLWIFCKELQPDRTITKDTIECMLADDYGKWTGNGITLFQSEFYLHKSHFFPDSGRYVIGVRQGMRDDMLKGIESVGLLVEKSARR